MTRTTQPLWCRYCDGNCEWCPTDSHEVSCAPTAETETRRPDTGAARAGNHSGVLADGGS